MSRYLVMRPWGNVQKGEVIESDSLHPALLPHVQLIEDERALEVATPRRGRKRKEEPQGDTE